MSKKRPKSPPRLYFSGALSATLTKRHSRDLLSLLFPEHCRPMPKPNMLLPNVFRSIVGQQNVKSPNFASNQRGKVLWQEQSLT